MAEEKIEVVEVTDEKPEKKTTKKASTTTKAKKEETKKEDTNSNETEEKDNNKKKSNNQKSPEEHIKSPVIGLLLWIFTIVSAILTVFFYVCVTCSWYVNVLFQILLLIKFICSALALAGGIYRWYVKVDDRANIIFIFLNAFLLII